MPCAPNAPTATARNPASALTSRNVLSTPAILQPRRHYLQTNRHDKALRLLRQAKGRWPRDPDVFNAIAAIEGAKGNLAGAVKALQEALAVAPGEATTYFNMGKARELRSPAFTPARQGNRIVDRE